MSEQPAGPTPVGPAAPSSGRVFLVRHGETEWSESGRHTGLTDVPLTDRGKAQAVALGPMLADFLGERPPALVLTSPLQRARVTAELAGLDAGTEPDLHEVDYGEYEGLTTPEIRRRVPGWTVWSGELPGGETLDQVAARVDRVLARISPALGRGDVVLVAHGHVLRILAARWLRQPPQAGRLLALSTATVSVLGHEHEYPVIRHWNLPNPIERRSK
jgi:probable phosphoglycerate mutase